MQASNLGENLIFIISLPRSGSTLLQHMLGSHSQIAASAEPWMLFPTLASLKKDVIKSVYDHQIAQIALKDFFAEIPHGEDEYYKAIRMMSLHMYNLFIQSKQKSFFLDKTSRYHIILPEIFRTFPQAKFIFLLRNPLATFKSFIEIMAAGDIMALSNLSIRNDLLHGYHNILEGIDLIKNSAVVHYEKLVTDPEDVIHQLCTYLKIPLELEMINYRQKEEKYAGKLVDPKSIYKHEKPVSDYLDTWKFFFEDPQMNYIGRAFLEYLGDRIYTQLGYAYEEDKKILQKNDPRKSVSGHLSLVSWNDLMTSPEKKSILQNYKIHLKLLWQKYGFIRMVFYACQHPISNLRLLIHKISRKG